MTTKTLRWVLALSGMTICVLLTPRVRAFTLVEVPKDFVTTVTRDNVERFRVDLNTIEDQPVEVVLPKDRSVTVMTPATNMVTLTADASTNMIVLDASTNAVSRVEAPKPVRFRSMQMPTMSR